MFVWRTPRWGRQALVFVLALCLLGVNGGLAAQEDDFCKEVRDSTFSVLILGDSQMAGEGWEGGYGNCIEEAYPNAQVVNLAQSGSLLANGDIQSQWAYYLSTDLPMPDIILLDGGINDLSYMKREEHRDNGLSLVTDAFHFLIESIHEQSPDTQIIYTIMPPLEEWDDPQSGPPSYEAQALYWKQLNTLANAYDYVTVLDMFSLNPFHFPCAECYCENLADSIHLSEAGYRNTFEYIDNMIMARLAIMATE